MHSLEQSCVDDHFFLSSTFNWFEFCLRMERPQPAVIVPRRENARFTIGDEGTLLGRGVSISGTCEKQSTLYSSEVHLLARVG